MCTRDMELPGYSESIHLKKFSSPLRGTTKDSLRRCVLASLWTVLLGCTEKRFMRAESDTNVKQTLINVFA